ncbi:hypothetical protein B9T62_32920 [Paenibacillus donghaensis]|uniref:Uncharacterized protein n=1 Tax=Paenibacillus donghaensis TaxID=414771 RepID=A0A2Z2KV91_9BACL|nr:hypothetical protein B9T62_32920 [Paenibacillus donghaensis]
MDAAMYGVRPLTGCTPEVEVKGGLFLRNAREPKIKSRLFLRNAQDLHAKGGLFLRNTQEPKVKRQAVPSECARA